MYKQSLVFTYIIILGLCLSPLTLQADDSKKLSSYRDAMQARQETKGKSKFSDEDRAVMERAATALASRLPDPGIKVGETAPDFSLPNAFGQMVNLRQELDHGPVILVFYRGAWCPFCNLHLHVLKENINEFEHYGARLITITPQKPDLSATQIKKSGYPFEVLSDLDSHVMQAYRLFFEVDPQLAGVYKKHGLDLTDYNGAGRNVLPVPGTFLIDRNGIVRAMQADTNYKQRMEPAAIIEALRDIDSQP